LYILSFLIVFNYPTLKYSIIRLSIKSNQITIIMKILEPIKSYFSANNKIYIYLLTLLFILSLISCYPTVNRNILSEFNVLYLIFNPKITLNYGTSAIRLIVGEEMTQVTPVYTGTINECSSIPTLPIGLELSQSNCSLSGNPSTIQSSLDYTIVAKNSRETVNKILSIAIESASALLSLSYNGSPYTFTNSVAITSINPSLTGTITSCTASPALPTCLTLDQTTCAISGTPTVDQASTTHSITASNTTGSIAASISVSVNSDPPSGFSYSGTPFTFTQNSAVSTISPNVIGSITSCNSAPALPTGITLGSSCQISGTPTVGQVATNFTITASNLHGSTNTTVSIAINASIPPSSLSYTGTPFIYTMNSAITDLNPNITGTVTSYSINTALPTGLSFNTTTGVISGTPTVTSTLTTYTITATNAAGSTQTTIDITVNMTPPSALSYAGTPFTFNQYTTITSANPTVTGTVSSYSINTPLPTGLSFNTTTGVISGTPTLTSASSDYTITATNAGGSTQTTINVTVNVPSPVTVDWGTFSDNGNGSIKLDVNAGTYGGQTYSAQTLTWMKCTHGQAWKSSTNDCTQNGTSPDYGGITVRYCSTDDNSCNDAATGVLNGTGTSTAYTACNDLNAGAGTLGKTNWRVPTKNELKLLVKCNTSTTLPIDGSNCGGSPSPSIHNLFPQTINAYNSYLTSNTNLGDVTKIWLINFDTSLVLFSSKSASWWVRCVSGP
jgi:hypothetical protein